MVSREQRRKQLARQKYLRQQQRRATARRRARIRNAVIAAGLVLALAGGGAFAAGAFGGGGDTTDNSAPSPSPTQADDPCDEPADGKPNGKEWKKEPKMAIDSSASYTMKLETTCGDIGIELDAENAPRTVNSFRFLAGEKFLDHTRCHRLVDQGPYVLQCGDPTGTGQGGPGYTIPDENLKDADVKDGTYPAGTVAMANTYNAQTGEGRDSGGSQFFLVYKDSPLPNDYTPFGKVSASGMKVLQKIADAGSVPDQQIQATVPVATVVIDKATVKED